jgi:inosine-uridine nucleoside N-ribohydrolase
MRKRRVIIDNDFSGDPDDLFQLVHHLLSPSVEIRGIIGSHLAPGDLLDPSGATAENAVLAAREVLGIMGLENACPVLRGSDHALRDTKKRDHSPASRFIAREALRDPGSELYLACGGGLTDAALALINEPEIAANLKIVWIGGPEHRKADAPRGAGPGCEYNLNIDPVAARYVYNRSGVELWQVPRNVYRQCLVSFAELERRVLPCGEIGRFLHGRLFAAIDAFGRILSQAPETYVLGDQPLVLLTALQSFFEPDASSCAYRTVRHKKISRGGGYAFRLGSRPVKVFDRVDSRLMFEDFYMKLKAFGGSERGER